MNKKIMKSNRQLLIFLLSVSVFSLNAQLLQEAMLKTENERFEEAGIILKALCTKEPGSGENWFYYGENFFKQAALDDFKTQDADSAMKMYQKGFDVNPTNPLPYIGMGKINLLQGKEKEANANFYKASTLIDPKKPNPSYQLRLAEAHIAVPKFKNADEAIKILNGMMKTDSKNPEVHVLMGDALFAKNIGDQGMTVKSYDKAFELDKKLCKAILKKGIIYKLAHNEKLGLQYFQEALKVDSTFAPAYRVMAELYHDFGKNERALENMKKYVKFNPSEAAKKRLVEFKFVLKAYKEVIPMILDLQKNGMVNCYLNRYLGWAYYEAGDKFEKDAYKKGLEALDKFFTCEGPNFSYLPQDYKYRGLLISKAFKDSMPMLENAVAVLKQAIDVGKDANCELWTDIGGLYMKMKKYTDAINAFNTKASCSTGMNGQDYYGVGRAYYFNNDCVNADTAFGSLIKTAPTNAIGYLWRAKANTCLDSKSDKNLAKPWYEKYFDLVKPEDRATPANKSNIIEAADYMAFYYYKQKDKEKLKSFVDVIQLLDPTNKKISLYNKFYNGK